MTFLEGILYMIWRGLAIGVIISAPMGPVGILCVQRTLEKGRLTGFFTGVGASISDLIYCLLTGFGLSFIEGFLKANQSVIQIIGSIVLIIFGVYLFKSTPARKLKKPGAEKASKGTTVLSGFLFTFSNPLIIFLIIGLFARFDFFLPEISFVQYMVGYVFIIVGALCWWWIVSYFVDKVRAHFNLRSMWLINKITGGIIMIFAIVGIVTAFSSKAEARGVTPVYLNESRGYGLLADSTFNGKLIISNESSDTMIRLMKIPDADNFVFTFRCANLNNASGRKYNFRDSLGNKCSVVNPAWGMVMKGENKNSGFWIVTTDPRLNEIEALSLDISSFGFENDRLTRVNDGVDFFIGQNSFQFQYNEGNVSLQAGNRTYNTVAEGLRLDFKPDSIGFMLAPGAKISIESLSLEPKSGHRPVSDYKWSHFGIEDVRNSYFSRTMDRMEGEWEIFDRMLDDDYLKTGGNYRLALVADLDGYEMIYIDGARKNPDFWKPGMKKGRLDATSFDNVYDVEWYDPSGMPLKGEIKAQFIAPDIINFQFPDHNSSSFRLKKLR